MENSPPPIVDSPEATAVHLSYIRRDIFEIKNQLADLKTNFASKEEFNDHETRLRSIEKSLWKWTGIASSVSVAASLLVQFLLK